MRAGFCTANSHVVTSRVLPDPEYGVGCLESTSGRCVRTVYNPYMKLQYGYAGRFLHCQLTCSDSKGPTRPQIWGWLPWIHFWAVRTDCLQSLHETCLIYTSDA